MRHSVALKLKLVQGNLLRFLPRHVCVVEVDVIGLGFVIDRCSGIATINVKVLHAVLVRQMRYGILGHVGVGRCVLFKHVVENQLDWVSTSTGFRIED